jgi:predicted DNA-binding transcriptional regulator AlpA
MTPRFIRIRELASTPRRAGRLPVSPATVWRWVKTGDFPPPVRLGPQTTAWALESVLAWEQRQSTAGAKP